LRTGGFALDWLDIAALLAEGGLWLAWVGMLVARAGRHRPVVIDGVPSRG